MIMNDAGTVLSGALRYFVTVCLSYQSESVSALHCSGLQIRGCDPNKLSYFSTKVYNVGTQKNCLNETMLLSTINICLD